MLPKKNRVSKGQFQKVFKQGAVRRTPDFSVRFFKNINGFTASVVVPKAVSKSAVERNSIRRKWYSVIRSFSVKDGTYIFFLTKSATTLSLVDIKKALLPFLLNK